MPADNPDHREIRPSKPMAQPLLFIGRMTLTLILTLLAPGWALLLVGFLTAPYGTEDRRGFRTVPVRCNNRREDDRGMSHGFRYSED